jgi:hypothetical protein
VFAYATEEGKEKKKVKGGSNPSKPNTDANKDGGLVLCWAPPC